MDFDFSSDQYMLRDSVRSFLDDQWGPRKLRAAAGQFSADLWRGLCGLGLQTLLIPETEGGAGLGFVDLALVLEEFGRALVPPPTVDTLLASEVIARFGTPQQRAALLPQIAAGNCRFAFAHSQAGAGHTADEVTLAAEHSSGLWRLRGEKILVPDALAATHLLVSAKPQHGAAGLFICEADAQGLARQAHRAMAADGLLGSVAFDGTRARALGDAPDPRALARLLETSTLAAALQLTGMGAAALDIAVAHALQRTQFDRPIGSFQAIKHKCADMLVALEGSRAAAYYGAWAVAEDHALLRLAVSMAKAVCGDACRLICNDALQIHGGVGFTWDYDIHFYLKRGKQLEYAFGDASFHRERVAELVLPADARAPADAGAEAAGAT